MHFLAAAARHIYAALDGRILAGTAGLFLVFLLVEPFYHATSRLPRTVYETPFITGAALISSPAFLAGWVATLVVLWRAPRATWMALAPAARWLWLPTAAALFALTWHLTTLDYNWALDRVFLLDRVLLAALAVLALLHPAFLSAFIVSAHAFTGQLNVSPLYFNWTDTKAIYQILLVLFIWTTLHDLRLWGVRWRGRSLHVPIASGWALLLGILGSWYFLSAVGKVQLGWLWENNLAHLVRAAYEQTGWLTELPDDTYAFVVDSVERFAVPMQFAALLAEGLVLLYFASRWTTVGILAFCIGLHVMIFATTGILFWKWALVNLALIVAFVAMGREGWKRAFPRWTMLCACASIIVLHTSFGPRLTKLAWFDSPFVHRFHFEVTGESGQLYEAIPSTFAPFDSRFAQARWYYLTRVPRLVDCFGSTDDRDLYHALLAAQSPEEVNRIVSTAGTSKYSDSLRADFTLLMRQFLDVSYTRAETTVFDAGPLKAPLHIWSRQRSDATLPLYTFQEPATRVAVTLVHRHYFDDAFVVVSSHDVLTVSRETESQSRDSTRSVVIRQP